MTRDEFDEAVTKIAEEVGWAELPESAAGKEKANTVKDVYQAGVLALLEIHETLTAVTADDIYAAGFKVIHAEDEKFRNRKELMQTRQDARLIRHRQQSIPGPEPDIMESVEWYLKATPFPYGDIIRRWLMKDETQQSLAKEYGLSDTTLSRNCRMYLERIDMFLCAELDQPRTMYYACQAGEDWKSYRFDVHGLIERVKDVERMEYPVQQIDVSKALTSVNLFDGHEHVSDFWWELAYGQLCRKTQVRWFTYPSKDLMKWDERDWLQKKETIQVCTGQLKDDRWFVRVRSRVTASGDERSKAE
jgi:hypothetical protein